MVMEMPVQTVLFLKMAAALLPAGVGFVVATGLAKTAGPRRLWKGLSALAFLAACTAALAGAIVWLIA
jgi:hypothetical protein